MAKKHDPIAEALDLTPLDSDFEIAKAEPLTFHVDDEVKDYEKARQQMYDLMAKGNQALEMLMQSANDQPTTGKFEVMSTLISTMSNMNMQLLDLQNKYRNLRPPQPISIPSESGKKRQNIPELLAEAKST